MNRQWTEEKINDWYKGLPWLRGCNYLPSNCVNRLDMWQSYQSMEHLRVADKELEMCAAIGFNTVRLWLNFDVYYSEKEAFLDILEKYISLCKRHGQYVMLVCYYEEDLPYGEDFVPKQMGEQKMYYTHFNRDYALYNKLKAENSFKHYMEYEEIRPLYLEMVETVAKKYADDERILCWNIANEPGILIGERSIPLIGELFEVVRSCKVSQPLCSDAWRGINENGTFRSSEETAGIELSDFISFHSYSKYDKFTSGIRILKEHYNRPVFVTEWLNRCNHNNVQDIYPFMQEQNVACYCWGFVAGRTMTTEPWDDLWTQYESNPDIEFDFTRWQHDLFRMNGRPYDPREIEVIISTNKMADEKYERI